MKKVKEETPDLADKLTILSTADYERNLMTGLVKHGYRRKPLKGAGEKYLLQTLIQIIQARIQYSHQFPI